MKQTQEKQKNIIAQLWSRMYAKLPMPLRRLPKPVLAVVLSVILAAFSYGGTALGGILVRNFFSSTQRVIASGGDSTYVRNEGGIFYRYHEFITTGTSQFIVENGGEIEFLVVAGGGAGGSGLGSGGGGAGGVITSSESISEGSHTVSVGAGGVSVDTEPGENGENSEFMGLVTLGGGGGGGVGKDGGSGGGGSGSGTTQNPGGAGATDQGNDGGSGGGGSSNLQRGGGGGGASDLGSNGDITAAGGDGLEWPYQSDNFYAGGGGGGARTSTGGNLGGPGGSGGGGAGGSGDIGDDGYQAAGAGEASTGGGGGGGGRDQGGNGGSGIVIIKYVVSGGPSSFVQATGGDNVYTTVEDGITYKVHEFTTVGESEFIVEEGGHIEYLVVGGGGGGGSATNTVRSSGGGGAGGVLHGADTVEVLSFQVVVGNGGPGDTWSSAASGESSFFGDIEALGGGGGGRGENGIQNGASGGSGGGGGGEGSSVEGGDPSFGGLGTPGQGNKGGDRYYVGLRRGGAGGGGAGAPGADNNTSLEGTDGGAGVEVWGDWYGGGGGGGSGDNNPGIGGVGGGGNGSSGGGQNGEPNTGGGGGGTNGFNNGGEGGSGIVVIRYQQMQPSPIISGGEVKDEGGFRYHIFKDSGQLDIERGGNVEYLVVAGGGAGGGSSTNAGGGGGGAGGLLTSSTSLNDSTYQVTVGAGGLGEVGGQGGNGQDSSLGTIVASGGGGGGRATGSAATGGSGGGAGASTNLNTGRSGASGIAGQGNDGGGFFNDDGALARLAGGGGGANEPGYNSSSDPKGGDGGDGLEWPGGSGDYYAGGGAGAGSSEGVSGVAGLGSGAVNRSGSAEPNTGGGGNGGYGAGGFSGGNGGSGIVIIRYPYDGATIRMGDLQRGLVGHWTMDRNTYNPNTGRLSDQTPNGNHGTNNGATFTSDRLDTPNSAMSFSGAASEHIDIAHTDGLNPSANMSISSWIKLEDTVDMGVFGKQNSFDLRIQPQNGNIRVNLVKYFVQDQWVNTGVPWQTGEWLHLAAVQLPDEVNYYINGALVGSYANSDSYSINTSDLYIGRTRTIDGWTFTGAIDDLRFYNRSLEASEVQELYDGYRPVIQVSDLQSGLIGNWDFSRDTYNPNTNRLSDLTPYSNHGTNFGATFTQDRNGMSGGAMRFDGLADYIDTGFDEQLDNWTISAWVRSPNAPENASPSGPFHRQYNYHINWNQTDEDDRGSLAVRVGGAWYTASYGLLEANTWYHLAGTYDGSTLRAYKNGVLTEANSSPSGPPDSEPATLKFGKHASSEAYFNGDVMSARLYNRPLSATEIQALAESY